MRRLIAVLLALTPLACFAAEFGFASWYGYPFHGRTAADGSIYDMEQITAAHKTLPLGSWVRVTNLKNGKEIDVRITDRGPFIDGRVIDLSRAAARALDVLDPGTAPVRVEMLQGGQPVPIPSVASVVLAEVMRANMEQMGIPAKPQQASGFAVQVGAYQDRGNAERMAERMRQKMQTARIVARPGTPVIWRVVIGDYEKSSEAEQAAAQVRAGGAPALAIQVDQIAPTSTITAAL